MSTQRLRSLLLGSVTQSSSKSTRGDTRRFLIQGTDLIGTFEYLKGEDWKIVELESVTREEEQELELQKLAAIFDEWKNQATTKPENFSEPSENYGRACAAYFMRLRRQLSQSVREPVPMPVIEIPIPE